MYENIGGKIKGLAQSIFIIETIGAIVTGIILLLLNRIFLGLLVLFSGPIIAWVSSWLMYGFGQLIDNSDMLVTFLGKQLDQNESKNDSDKNFKDIANEKTSQSMKTFRTSQSNISTNIKRCPLCGEKVTSKTCNFCGSENNLF